MRIYSLLGGNQTINSLLLNNIEKMLENCHFVIPYEFDNINRKLIVLKANRIHLQKDEKNESE